MFSFIEKHPFVSGCIAGVIAVGVIRKKMKRLFDGKITIIQLDLSGISLASKEDPEEDESPDAQEENSEEN